MSITWIEAAPLRALNTFGVSARARQLCRIDSLSDVPRALARIHEQAQDLPFILGGGSNLLIADDIEQTVLQPALLGRRVVRESGEQVIVEAMAGESWDALVRWSLSIGLCGLENLALIPGTAGAAPIQNIGAYGVEQRDTFESLDAIDLHTGSMRRFDAIDCAFAYRDSIFKQAGAGAWLVLAVRYALSRKAALKLDYGDIRSELASGAITSPKAQQVADAVSAIRRRKLPDPAVLGNAGSFFKNPLVSTAQAAALKAREPQLPVWANGDCVKLAAAWMIDQCGWKGYRDGDAGVHTDHALVLVNHGQARGAQLLSLARRIQDSVQQRFGVRLEAEPVVVPAATL